MISCLEHIFMVLKVFEPLKFYCIYVSGALNVCVCELPVIPRLHVSLKLFATVTVNLEYE